MRQQVAYSSLRQLLNTFFGGSVEQVVATLLSDDDAKLSETELDRLSALIEQARGAQAQGEPASQEPPRGEAR